MGLKRPNSESRGGFRYNDSLAARLLIEPCLARESIQSPLVRQIMVFVRSAAVCILHANYKEI